MYEQSYLKVKIGSIFIKEQVQHTQLKEEGWIHPDDQNSISIALLSNIDWPEIFNWNLLPL